MDRVKEVNVSLMAVEKLISTIAIEQGFQNFDVKIKAITTNGANYMGDLYLVDIIEDGKKTLNLFAKAANTPENVRDMIPANEVYKTEVFMYTTLADTFHDLQERHAVPDEKRFKFPKHYGSNLKEMEEVIILENLMAQGFELFDRFKPIDWKYAKAAVEEIAKFHAISFALEKENPDIFDKLVKSRPNKMFDNVESMEDSMLNLLTVSLSVVEPENYGKLRKYIDENKNSFMNMMALTQHSSLIHGDFRMSNIMVKYQEGSVVSLKPVDYQTAMYGCPLIDILYFLFTGSDEEFRRKHFEDYLEHYHNTLTDHLKLLSQDVNDIYPKKESHDHDDDYVYVNPKNAAPVDDEKSAKRARNIVELQQRLEKVKQGNNYTLKNKLMKKSLTTKLNKKSRKAERKLRFKLKSKTPGEFSAKKETEEKPEKIKIPQAKPVFNSDGKLVFSKFDFTNVGKKNAKKNKTEKDPKKILDNLKKQEETFKQLQESGETEKAAVLKEKIAWKNVLAKAEGEKVKDDPLLLKKSMKIMDNKKKRSEKKWDERIQNVEQGKQDRQKKRQENIAKKKKEKKSKKIKRATKKGRIVL